MNPNYYVHCCNIGLNKKCCEGLDRYFETSINDYAESTVKFHIYIIFLYDYLLACEIYSGPLLRGQPDERPPPLKRPIDNVNLNKNILIFTPDERPPLLKGHFSDANGMASQEGFHCIW